MQLPQMNSKQLTYIIGLIVSIIVWSYFLSASQLSLDLIFNLNFAETIQKITSFNFIGFLITFPFTYALISLMCKYNEKNSIQITALIGTLIGLIVSLIVFQNLSSFYLIGAFYFLSVFLLIENAFTKLEELKKMVSVRLVSSCVQRGITILAIGIFVFSVFSILPMQEQYVKEVDNKILDMAVGTAGQEQLLESTADIMIQNQRAVLLQLMSIDQFSALKQSNDANAVAFALIVEGLNTEMQKPEFKAKIVSELKKEKGNLFEQSNVEEVFAQVKEKIPFYNTFSQWLWLIMSFIITSIFLLVGSIIFRPLAVLYGLIMEGMVKILFKPL